MSSDLREPLHDLVSEVPGPVASEDLAAATWAAGRRRRLRRRIFSTAAVLAVIGVVAGSLLTLHPGPRAVQPAGTDTSPRVGGYPQRIVHQWWTPALPSSPGPVAGLVESGRDLQWDVVSEHGHLWQSPPTLGGWYPSLSPDGRYLGYLAGRNGPYLVHDLVTGNTQRFGQVGCGCGGSTNPYWMSTETPALWSPDDQHLLLFGSTIGPSHVRVLLLGRGGRVEPFRMATRWNPAGWATPTQLVWAYGHRTPTGKVADIELTDLSGQPLRKLQMQLPNGTSLQNLSQFSWTVSPNGHQLLLTAPSDLDTGYVATYSLQDGSILTTSRAADLNVICPSGWAGTTPVAPKVGPREAAETVTATTPSKPVAVTDPNLFSQCVIWASDALSGTAHGGLFGTATGDWTWWWRETLAALGALILIVLIARAVHNRWRHAATSAKPAP